MTWIAESAISLAALEANNLTPSESNLWPAFPFGLMVNDETIQVRCRVIDVSSALLGISPMSPQYAAESAQSL